MAARKQTISDLRNLGPKSQAILSKIGIDTLAQLRKAGAVCAYVKAKRAEKSVSLNLLYGLVGSIEDCDWRQVQRQRKLELLNAIEAYEEQHPVSTVSELGQLRNIGKAMMKDFELLGVTSIKQLARCNADKLYERIQSLTNTRHDPCVWDTYAAAIHQAKTGEALPWWDFTKVRKGRSSLPLPLRERVGVRGGAKRSRQSQKTPHPALSRKGRG
jgi:TfoX C-terminal domain/Pathogenicity locus